MMTDAIGTLNEQPLHSALKEYYASGGGRMEVNIEGYIIDVIRDNQLIEIQTQNFYAIRRKIFELINNNRIKLVFPVAKEKWLLKLPGNNHDEINRRKSPKQGRAYQVFSELVSFPNLLKHSNFTLEIVMADVEEVRRYTGEKRWRQNGWRTLEQRLIRVVEIIPVQNPTDLIALLPKTPPVRFTTSDLHESSGIPKWLAQKAAYCMRKAGAVQQVGKRGRFHLYEQVIDPKP